MHFRRNRIKIDLTQHMGKYIKTNFVYGMSDCNSSYLELEILNEGKTVNLEDYTVICSIVKSDNKCIFNECNIENTTNGIIEILLTTQALASDGTNYLQLILKNKDVVITSPIITYEVVKTILSESEDIIKSTNELPILIDLIDKVNKQHEECINIHNEITNSEVIRVEKENERQSLELERISNESTRVNNEDIRVLSELERSTKENERIRKELERIKSEKNRVSNENERITKDTNRDNKENLRNLAEISRVDNEGIRVSSENNRKSSESKRVKSEEVRESNELVRKEQERIREQSMTNIKNEFNKLTVSKQQDAEVIIARQSPDGTVYGTLKERLDKIELQTLKVLSNVSNIVKLLQEK